MEEQKPGNLNSTPPTVRCLCGCGLTPPIGVRSRPWMFLNGHAVRSPEARANIGAANRGRLRPWLAEWNRRNNSAMKTRHGHTRGRRGTKTWGSWAGMVKRCTNPNTRHWKNYGGRGITASERWLVFENFLADMGERPVGKTIDRKDNDLGYFPENCKWSTPKEQRANRRPVAAWGRSGKRHGNAKKLDVAQVLKEAEENVA